MPSNTTELPSFEVRTKVVNDWCKSCKCEDHTSLAYIWITIGIFFIIWIGTLLVAWGTGAEYVLNKVNGVAENKATELEPMLKLLNKGLRTGGRPAEDISRWRGGKMGNWESICGYFNGEHRRRMKALLAEEEAARKASYISRGMQVPDYLV